MLEYEIFAKILHIPKLPSYLDRVEKHIRELVSNANPNIKTPIDRLLSGLQKPKRAFLVIASALCQDGHVDDRVIAGASAIELANIGVSVHDDIMDNAETRWGVTSVNAKEGQGQALLVGDYLLALAIDQGRLADGRAAKLMADSITTMVNGQSQETADRFNLDRSFESYLKSIRMKSASLTASACEIGGICAGLSEKKLKSLYTYGEAVGMTMQMLDDLLDLLSTDEIMGKPVDRDVREGIYTMPVIFGLNSPVKLRIKTLLKDLPKNEDAQPELLKLLISSGAIDKSFQKVSEINKSVASIFDQFDNNRLVDGLMRLPADFVELILDHHVVRLHA
jgi:heptaprenyl diphosphate synthase